MFTSFRKSAVAAMVLVAGAGAGAARAEGLYVDAAWPAST
jgi:hypothetical protein